MKKIKLKKDKWVLIGKNVSTLKVDFPEFKQDNYKLKIDDNEIKVKSNIIKMNGQNKKNVYIFSKVDSFIFKSDN